MSENCEKTTICVSQKAQDDVCNIVFCPQHKYIQFTVGEEERNQETFTFKKLFLKLNDSNWSSKKLI